MTDPEITALSFPDATALQAWFTHHHAQSDELWVRLAKKGTGHPSVDWNDCVRICLAWGWIDGIKRSGGKGAWFQRLTPRRARSNWSARNAGIASELIATGAMQAPGLAQVALARQQGRWPG